MTLNATVNQIRENDQIYTDQNHTAWTISRYYYPGVSSRYTDFQHFLELNKDITYWFYLMQPMSAHVHEGLQSQGFKYETVVHDGILGTHQIWIYKVCHSQTE